MTSPVVGPGPGGINGTNTTTTILTAPEELKPLPPNNGSAGPPSAKLTSNCTLVVTDATGKVTWTSNTSSTNGPCSLTLDDKGQLCIKDLSGVSIWCNNATTNGTACAPYSLTATAAGSLIETDACNSTAEPVWRVPPADPDGGEWGSWQMKHVLACASHAASVCVVCCTNPWLPPSSPRRQRCVLRRSIHSAAGCASGRRKPSGRVSMLRALQLHAGEAAACVAALA